MTREDFEEVIEDARAFADGETNVIERQTVRPLLSAIEQIELLILECGDYEVKSPTGQTKSLEWVLRDALSN